MLTDVPGLSLYAVTVLGLQGPNRRLNDLEIFHAPGQGAPRNAAILHHPESKRVPLQDIPTDETDGIGDIQRVDLFGPQP